MIFKKMKRGVRGKSRLKTWGHGKVSVSQSFKVLANDFRYKRFSCLLV